MVRGLEKFRIRFESYSDRYVLIGGTASYLVLTEAGIPARATKDLDIVLCLESLDAEFIQEFWQFIVDGGYQSRQQSTGKRTFYRFSRPTDPEFPVLLELFSRRPEHLLLTEGSHLTPIPADEEASSLSAILLEDDYYNLIIDHKRDLDGLSIVAETCLIPLKAFAWLSNTERQKQGQDVKSTDITKHQNDVIRLSALLSPQNSIIVPTRIYNDLQRFFDAIETKDIDMRAFGRQSISIRDVIADLRKCYQPKR